MFYVMLTYAVPFAAELPLIIDQCAAVDGLKPMLARARIAHPNEELIVTETLFTTAAAMPKIPPELARAVELWNAIADRARPKLPKLRAIGNYVGPYRRWKKKNEGRDYLLEDVVAAVERATWTHPFIHFAWLLGSKDGALNCDKVLNGNGLAKGRRAAGNGEEFEAERR
jgi:hypothetical protein